jgi:hypothetical protein
MRYKTEKRWVVPVSVSVGLLCLFLIGAKLASPAGSQERTHPQGDSGILVVPVQIERDSYGLAMVDTANQTLWIYELNSRGPIHRRLRLLAARSWKYDRLLQQYNTDEPTPERVKTLLEEFGQLPQQWNEEKQLDPGSHIWKITSPNTGSLDR